GLHTGPIKLSGGIRGRELTPSVDGNFDRISFEIDPLYGSEQELVQMSRMAAAHNAVTIDDLIPSHTGKGADFRLAEMAHGPYTGLF
ncbi:maltose alpha-D-glucosyltransferase, partial [Pseudomonas syringae]